MSSRLNRMLAWPSGAAREGISVSAWAPAVDISESETEYLVKADLPEIKREDVKVTVQNGVLTMRDERKAEKEEKGKRFHRIEREYGSFMRTFQLPDDVDEAKLTAELKDGVLNVHLPESPAKAKSRAVNVEVD